MSAVATPSFTGLTHRLPRPSKPAPAFVLGALLLLVGGVTLWMTRGSTFYRDDWYFVSYRDGHSLTDFFAPQRGHLFLVQALYYVLCFKFFGLASYLPFKLALLAVELGLAAGLYLYCRPRVGPWTALLPAVIVVTFGPGADDLVWGFQMGFMLPVAAAFGVLIALETDAPRDRTACAFLTLALTSGGIGLAVLVGVIFDWALRPRRVQRLWVWVGPSVAWGAWYVWLGRTDDQVSVDNIRHLPKYVFDLASNTGSGIITVGESAGQFLIVGVLGLMTYQYLSGRGPRRQALVLLAMLLSFWALIALTRAQYGQTDASRYLLPGAVLLIALVCELAHGRRLSTRGGHVALVGVALVLLTNVALLSDSADRQRRDAALVQASLSGVSIAGPGLNPSFNLRTYTNNAEPLAVGPIFAAAHHWRSSPALSEADLSRASAGERRTADDVMQAYLRVRVTPTAVAPSTLRSPEASRQFGGAVTSETNGCVTLRPDGLAMSIDATYSSTGLYLRAIGPQPVDIALRRFSSTFSGAPIVLAPGSAGVLRIPADRSRQPWQVRTTASSRAEVCALG